jgi:hypothetical protein
MNTIDPNKWRKGGMTSNGLRRSGEVVNYFTNPGRQNIIPNADPNKGDISSIGILQTNGLGLMSASSYGPGTIKSTNLQIRIPNGTSENQMGFVIQNDKRSQFVDYRSTAPFLVENLKHNPLSIYSVGSDMKDKPIPAFFSYIRPNNYNTYKSEPTVDISKETIQEAIDGSPQVNILGLAHQNPFMGITANIPNDKPEFDGKTYGGDNSGNAKPYADFIYNQTWTTNTLKPIHQEQFGEEKCQNKALHHFAQGYNISNQINDNKMVEWVEKDQPVIDNLPWGPRKVTLNPRTQIGGIWNKGNEARPTRPNEIGYQNNPRIQHDFNKVRRG